jgi:hypothetical protein
MNDKWTICTDTVCDGFSPVGCDEDDNPQVFDTEDEAIAELEDDLEFYEDCFVCQLSEVGHKAIVSTLW